MKQGVTTIGAVLIASLVSLPASAQSQTSQPDEQKPTKAPIFQVGAESGLVEPIDGFFKAERDVVLATSLIGETLYTNASDDGEPVGQIRDVVMARGGSVEAVVVGVGGFLGMGEKDVAVSFDRITRTVDEEDDVWLVIEASAEELDRAPAFDRAAQSTLAVEGDYASATAYRISNLAREAVRNTQPDIIDVDSGLLRQNIDMLVSLPAYDSAQERIGRVVGLAVAPAGAATQLVVEVGGVFGVGGRRVTVAPEEVQILTFGEEWDGVAVRLPQEEVEARPRFTGDIFQGSDEAAALEVPAD